MMSENPKIPEVYEDECENWWAEGHIDPPTMALAVIVEVLVLGDREYAVTLLTGGDDPVTDEERNEGRTHADRAAGMRSAARELVGRVRHQWMKPDPEGSEMSVVCGESDPEAEAWTWMSES